MNEYIILKKQPRIEFRILSNGFYLIDGQTEENSGFYAFTDLQTTELNYAWFPKLAMVLRIITGFMNIVPFFPTADAYKKANLIMHFSKRRLGIWLTNPYMAGKAKRLKEVLDEKTTPLRSCI